MKLVEIMVMMKVGCLFKVKVSILFSQGCCVHVLSIHQLMFGWSQHEECDGPVLKIFYVKKPLSYICDNIHFYNFDKESTGPIPQKEFSSIPYGKTHYTDY